jgi:hypothetical protein
MLSYSTPSEISAIVSRDLLQKYSRRGYFAGRTTSESSSSSLTNETTQAASSKSVTLSSERKAIMIRVPKDFDILCGRGRRVQEHMGNVLLHRLLDMHIARYTVAPRNNRKHMATEIVQAMKRNGTRFLKRDGANGEVIWREIDDDAATEKVSHCFRSRRQHTSNNALGVSVVVGGAYTMVTKYGVGATAEAMY